MVFFPHNEYMELVNWVVGKGVDEIVEERHQKELKRKQRENQERAAYTRREKFYMEQPHAVASKADFERWEKKKKYEKLLFRVALGAAVTIILLA